MVYKERPDLNETFVIRIAFHFDWDFKKPLKRFTFFYPDNPSIATQSSLHYYDQFTNRTLYFRLNLSLVYCIFQKAKKIEHMEVWK